MSKISKRKVHRKKNVALFACKDVRGSNASCPWLLSPSAGMTGVLLSFLMSYKHINTYTASPSGSKSPS